MTVEGALGDNRMFLSQFRDVRPVRAGIAEEAKVERITRADRQVRVVGQHNGHQGTWYVGRVERSHVHPAFGQGARLVCCNDGDRAKGLDSREAPDNGSMFGHALDTESQRDREHRR